MGLEIERKFLLSSDICAGRDDGVEYVQGYIRGTKNCVVRIRIMGEAAVITVKSKLEGISSLEYEYPVPIDDAAEMLELICGKPLIEKARYKIEYAGKIWDVDSFYGANAGLSLAEVELDAEDEEVELPPWVGEEVTGQDRYFNVNLSKNPFISWEEDLNDER
ncbi:MAG: CYTH domain-containing protein [Kiritimatiellae bacterium]|nr:CYTH domain-containing protein [Kiritimatiellia bacterium]